jgi:hypothetical protein
MACIAANGSAITLQIVIPRETVDNDLFLTGLTLEKVVIRIAFFPRHSSNQLQPLDLCLFGVTKKLLRRVNNLDSVNVQTKHIAGVICAFLAAAVPLTIIRTFKMSGMCLVKDGAQLLCTIHPERAKRLLVPLPQILPELETDGDDSGEAESQAYLEECAELFYDLESDEMHNPQ